MLNLLKHIKIKSIFIVIATLQFTSAYANLLPNPSFELYSQVPDNWAQIDRATDWSRPTHGTPDYLHALSPNASFATPTNMFGDQSPYDGDAYAGFSLFHNFLGSPALNYREYIETPLISSLVAGENYELSFYVSLADISMVAIQDISAYFSVGEVGLVENTENLGFTPQVSNTGGIISDKNGWTKISGEFTASGGEDHMVIGNFLDYNSTTSLDLEPGTNHEAYYYIDNVSLISASAVPVPAAFWLFGSGFLSLIGIARRKA